ncbi:MAG: polysaccharide deacetylase family protein [Thermoleophilia bacterium]
MRTGGRRGREPEGRGGGDGGDGVPEPGLRRGEHLDRRRRPRRPLALRGEFGANVGAPRLLDLCRRLGVPSTWFVPGHTAESHPAVTARIATDGHEVAAHGYLHEDFSALDPDEARAVLRRANDALERITGQRPRGIRLPPWAMPDWLAELLLDEGFAYDSSLMGDCRAYWTRAADLVPDDGPVTYGRELPLVQLPVTFITSDFAYFEFNGYGRPALPAGLRNPRDVEQIWLDELTYLEERGEPGAYLMLMLHPQAIGWGGRMLMLERVLEAMLARGARFVTAETLAEGFRATAAPPA